MIRSVGDGFVFLEAGAVCFLVVGEDGGHEGAGVDRENVAVGVGGEQDAGVRGDAQKARAPTGRNASRRLLIRCGPVGCRCSRIVPSCRSVVVRSPGAQPRASSRVRSRTRPEWLTAATPINTPTWVNVRGRVGIGRSWGVGGGGGTVGGSSGATRLSPVPAIGMPPASRRRSGEIRRCLRARRSRRVRTISMRYRRARCLDVTER